MCEALCADSSSSPMKTQPQYLFDSNGASVDPALAMFPNFGDGVFETVLVVNGELPFWKYHCARLEKSLYRLHIPLAQDIIDQCLVAVLKMESQVARGFFKLRLQVFRGAAAQYSGYASKDATPLIKIDIEKIAEPCFESVDLTCSTIRLAFQPFLAGLKHMNRLEQVLARKELDLINSANESSFSEALLFDQDDRLVEAIAANVFIQVDGQWRTPSLDGCGIEGVIRSWLVDQAFSELGQSVSVESIALDSLAKIDAMFICNAITGIREVRSLVLPGANVKGESKMRFSQSSHVKAIASYWLSTVGV